MERNNGGIVRSFLTLVIALVICQTLTGQETASLAVKGKSAPIEVMFLATYHLSDPGQDAVNMHVDDVLKPKRQQELAALAKQLELFKPTKIAVEARSAAPGFIWKDPLDPNDLKTKRNEVYQIGERVALGSGLDKLYGVDNDGEFDLEPVKLLDGRRTGGTRTPKKMNGIQNLADEADRKLQTMTISQATAWLNSPKAIKMNNDFYMQTLEIADGEDQPAAKLDAEWYERNLRI